MYHVLCVSLESDCTTPNITYNRACRLVAPLGWCVLVHSAGPRQQQQGIDPASLLATCDPRS